jgi:Bacterial SH3 domain
MRSSGEKAPISELAQRFVEPLLGDSRPGAQTASARRAKDRIMVPPVRVQVAAPEGTSGRDERAVTVGWLIAALVTVALVPMWILIVTLWPGAFQQTANSPASFQNPTSAASETTGAIPVSQTLPDIALTSPEKIEAKPGDEVDFAITVDSVDPLPARSLIAISAMPEGATFSEGRPYGVTGWSLRPNEIGELRLRLPMTHHGASDMRIELVSGDGAQLAKSETRLDIAPAVESDVVASIETDAAQQTDAPPPQIAQVAEAPLPAGEIIPIPLRKPGLSATVDPAVKVNTVKVVTIKAPEPKRPPHDGAWALGQAADAPAEWMEIVSAVDVHARPQQSSETVKVVERGLKVRVTARDRNWIQVSDPKSSMQGWIYKRFLKPTASP